jgi:hypothetical protein
MTAPNLNVEQKGRAIRHYFLPTPTGQFANWLVSR